MSKRRKDTVPTRGGRLPVDPGRFRALAVLLAIDAAGSAIAGLVVVGVGSAVIGGVLLVLAAAEFAAAAFVERLRSEAVERQRFYFVSDDGDQVDAAGGGLR